MRRQAAPRLAAVGWPREGGIRPGRGGGRQHSRHRPAAAGAGQEQDRIRQDEAHSKAGNQGIRMGHDWRAHHCALHPSHPSSLATPPPLPQTPVHASPAPLAAAPSLQHIQGMETRCSSQEHWCRGQSTSESWTAGRCTGRRGLMERGVCRERHMSSGSHTDAAS